MKKFFLTTVLLVSIVSAKAQDPNLFQQWYLYEIHLEQEPPIYISGWSPYGDPDYPQIHPDLSISEDLSFSGNGVCNSFQGQWETDDDLMLSIAFSETGQSCGLYENELEDHYFSLFQEEIYVQAAVNDLGDGLFEMYLGGGPFTGMRFLSEPILGLHDLKGPRFSLTPNPGKDLVRIEADQPWELLKVYDSKGALVLQYTAELELLDLSGLLSGLYFIEVYSGQSKAVERWIKQ